MKKIVALAVLSLFIGCGKEKSVQNTEGKPSESTQKPLAIADVSGKAFSFGPEFNAETCEIIAECDCCGSDFLFLDDSRFVVIAYCLEGDSFLKGTYRIVGSKIEMTYEGEMIVQETNWEKEADSTKTEAPFYFEKAEPAPKKGLTLSRQHCNGDRLILKLEGNENDFGAEEGKLGQAIAQLKKSGIWQKLGSN
ncbi:hypothetical protein [Flavobacterium sp.]|uniref:hypothetical protein n=1 Tax=Flavobacterium sp. TaxID=239 RepID=UPI00121B8F2F|nr:hypothetical protein [Flavobacterium sp.]RZJ69714.1 MAG: hypothetical protein EOO49_16410 [Flavobacterium sp.]